MAQRDDQGRYEVVSPAFDRRLLMDAFEAAPPVHPMVALLDLDVTRALEAIDARRRQGARVSLFAFLVSSIAAAIAEHPDVNVVRHGARLVRFEDVDVNVPVEVTTPEGKFPRHVAIRRVQQMSPEEVYAAIEAAKERHGKKGDLGDEDRRSRRLARLLQFVPRFLRILLMRLFMRNAFWVKRWAGTTLVTSVGKFASIPGFGFTLTLGPWAASFAIGSVVDKPCVVDGRIAVRSVLGLSIILNHDLIDGAPAARFATRLQELVESANRLPIPTPVSGTATR